MYARINPVVHDIDEEVNPKSRSRSMYYVNLPLDNSSSLDAKQPSVILSPCKDDESNDAKAQL